LIVRLRHRDGPIRRCLRAVAVNRRLVDFHRSTLDIDPVNVLGRRVQGNARRIGDLLHHHLRGLIRIPGRVLRVGRDAIGANVIQANSLDLAQARVTPVQVTIDQVYGEARGHEEHIPVVDEPNVAVVHTPCLLLDPTLLVIRKIEHGWVHGRIDREALSANADPHVRCERLLRDGRIAGDVDALEPGICLCPIQVIADTVHKQGSWEEGQVRDRGDRGNTPSFSIEMRPDDAPAVELRDEHRAGGLVDCDPIRLGHSQHLHRPLPKHLLDQRVVIDIV